MAVVDGEGNGKRHLAHWLLSALLVCPSIVSAKTVDEYGLKAVFLYNFFRFVDWPQGSSSGRLSLCILGDDPFGSTIDQLVTQKLVNGRRLEVRRLKEPGDARQCHLVFIRSGQKAKAMQLIEAVKGLPVLTVGELPDFGKMGGLLYLSMVDDQVNINIDASAAARAGLKVSAKLLSLAKQFEGP